jgi:aminoglycoside phosphotransferase (APT) family kinase protein
MSASQAGSSTQGSLPPKKAKALVVKLAAQHFQGAPKTVVQLAGGATNAVFSFRHQNSSYVMRLNADATKIQQFLKEHWALDQARAAGVPVPKVLEVGNLPEGVAYMLAQAVDGIPGTHCPDRLSVLHQLGKFTHKVHTVRTRGCGAVFDWSKNFLSKHATWALYLDEGLMAERRLSVLTKHRMLSHAQAQHLRRALEELRSWRRPTVLQHGDLRLKNTLVDEKSGRITGLIDWEDCISAPGCHWDLSIALHDLGVDERQAFLTGYGMKPAQFREVSRHLSVLNLLNYGPAVELLAESGNREELAWYRLRIQGQLELLGQWKGNH